MKPYDKLLLENKAWANEQTTREPDYFRKLVHKQTPDFLWIGCADSRVPAEIITNAEPGEIFVHRNIANQIVKTDFNSLSVVQYAVQVLGVKHVVVCGHYNCGGVRAALDRQQPHLTLVNKWLLHIKDVYRLHQLEIEALPTMNERANRLVELNVIEQVYNLAHTAIIQKCWKTERRPTLHGWVYGLDDGVIHELITLTPDHRIESIYQCSDDDSP
ncbi:MAG: carbonate dehydratase [Methylococcaceae bacterium]